MGRNDMTCHHRVLRSKHRAIGLAAKIRDIPLQQRLDDRKARLLGCNAIFQPRQPESLAIERIARQERQLPSIVIEQRCKILETQLGEKDTYIQELKIQMRDTAKQTVEISKQAHHLELELTAAHTKLEVQQAMAMELRAYMEHQKTAKMEMK